MERFAVEALAHFLESAGRKAAFHIGGLIAVIGPFVGRGSHPRLRNLEVVGQIDHLGRPLRSATEEPSPVQADGIALRDSRQSGENSQGQ